MYFIAKRIGKGDFFYVQNADTSDFLGVFVLELLKGFRVKNVFKPMSVQIGFFRKGATRVFG